MPFQIIFRKSVKILGVHISYDFQARHKFNVDELFLFLVLFNKNYESGSGGI